jgi:hypothetical protein
LPILNSVDEAEWTEPRLHFDIVYTVQKFGAFFTTVADTSRNLNLPEKNKVEGQHRVVESSGDLNLLEKKQG